MPSLKNLHRHFLNDNFALLTVDVQEKAEKVRRFAKKENLNFPILLDTDGEVSKIYAVRGHPKAFLINTDGNLLGVAPGYRKWDKKEMKELVRILLSIKDPLGRTRDDKKSARGLINTSL